MLFIVKIYQLWVNLDNVEIKVHNVTTESYDLKVIKGLAYFINGF